MPKDNRLASLFVRSRRPGDIVFAWLVLIASLFLLSQLFEQTAYREGGKLFAQPRFWPAVSLGLMTLFAIGHLAGSLLSKRIEGRWREVSLWVSTLEYAAWFVLYALAVPWMGYLPSTLIFALLLAFRLGYRSRQALIAAGLSALIIVLVFKTFLQVKLPAGQLYEGLPDGLRQIMLNYF